MRISDWSSDVCSSDLRSQMLGELALAEEAVGDTGSADARFTQSVDLLAAEYPETTALASARARYASFLTRHAQDDQAIGIYREVVPALANSQRPTAGMANVMAHYYRLLANRAATDPDIGRASSRERMCHN